MNEISLNTILTSGSSAGAKQSPQQIADAAKQFEAMLIEQMMKTARETGGGDFSGGDDQSGSSMSEMAEQQFAQVLASNGGMGLAKLVVEGLKQRKTDVSVADVQNAAGAGSQ